MKQGGKYGEEEINFVRVSYNEYNSKINMGKAHFRLVLAEKLGLKISKEEFMDMKPEIRVAIYRKIDEEIIESRPYILQSFALYFLDTFLDIKADLNSSEYNVQDMFNRPILTRLPNGPKDYL